MEETGEFLSDRSRPVRPVLVVEDEFLIAMMTETYLADLGFTEVVIARTLEGGLAHAEEDDFAFAILDVNLHGVQSFPIAERLLERGIPFGFQTAYGREGVKQHFSDHPVLTKPYSEEEMRAMVKGLIAEGEG